VDRYTAVAGVARALQVADRDELIDETALGRGFYVGG
jgi:hypothetical protein